MPISNPGAMDPIPVPAIETRDLAEAAGDVIYSGYGFQPTGLLIFAYKDTDEWSVGLSQPSRAARGMFYDNGVNHMVGMTTIVKSGASDFQTATIKAFNADGFELTWAKTGSPTGILQLHIVAFK